MNSNTVANSTSVVPCECGSTNAYWHGAETGLRVYCCDACWIRTTGPVPSQSSTLKTYSDAILVQVQNVIVQLDDGRFGAGPATVIALTDSIDGAPRDRDGCADSRLRVWAGYDGATIGDRVSARQFGAV